MTYNTPELLRLGSIASTVLNISNGPHEDSVADPVQSRPLSSVLDLD